MKLGANFFVTIGGDVLQKASPLAFNQRNDIFLRDKKVCRKCKSKVRMFGENFTFTGDDYKAHIDHIFPRSRGGQNDPSNLQLLCYSCNLSKGAR